jgi:hypothetical protein
MTLRLKIPVSDAGDKSGYMENVGILLCFSQGWRVTAEPILDGAIWNVEGRNGPPGTGHVLNDDVTKYDQSLFT